MLILDSGYFRIFDLLKIESHQFLTNASDRREFSEAVHPSHGGIDAVLEGRSQPAVRSGSIVKPGFPISEIPPSPSSEDPPVREPVPDLATPVVEFSQKQDMGRIFDLPCFERNNFLFSDQGDTGCLASWIELDPNGLNFSPNSIF
jgi:hypothetical protein